MGWRIWGDQATAEEHAPSGLQLFTAVLAIRWSILVMETALYARNLSTHERDLRNFLPVLAVLVLYNLTLTIYRRRAYESHMRSPYLMLGDYLLTAGALATSGGSEVWAPFYTYSWGPLFLSSLYGTWTAGILGAAAMAALYVLAAFVRGATPEVLTAHDETPLFAVLMIDYFVVALVWMGSSRAALRLQAACARLARGGAALAEAHRELDERGREALALHDIRKAILGKMDVDEVLRLVLAALTDMGFPRARILLASEAGPVPRLHGADASPAPSHPHDATPAALTSGRPVRIESDTSFHGVDVHAPALLVPIPDPAGAAGVMVVEGDDDLLFSERRLELLTLFAEQIALALQHLRLYRQASEFAVAEERNRLSLELHDTVVQKLYGASLLLDATMDAPVPGDVRDRLAKLKDSVGGALADLRFSVLEWDSLGWESDAGEMVERYVEEFRSLSDLPVALTVTGRSRELAPEKCKDLLRILQEALSNVWRHTEATDIEVRLAFAERGVTLSVRDDGGGFESAVVERHTGIGLRSMRTRAQRHGGRFTLESSPGRGTRVQAWMPS